MMQRQCECPKNKRFNNQNNNFAHAPGIFVYLFAIFVGLNYGEKIPNFVFYGERKQATTKFCFAKSELEHGPLEFTFRKVGDYI